MVNSTAGTTLAAVDNGNGLPESSVSWYREITALALDAPAWIHTLAEIGTEALIVLFGLMMIFNWWRARAGDDRDMALALLTPAATVLAYGISEIVKLVVHEQRPCRTVPGVLQTIADCPAPGDWSLPSNHSTIAAAAAVGLAFACRRAAVGLALLALLTGFSRVFVGVHYPHDVLVGLMLGVVIASVVLLTSASASTRLVCRLRDNDALRPLLSTETRPPARV